MNFDRNSIKITMSQYNSEYAGRIISRCRVTECFCGQKCSTRSGLKHHYEKKHPSISYQPKNGYRCKVCDWFATHKGEMERHLEIDHPITEEDREKVKLASTYLGHVEFNAIDVSEFVYSVHPLEMCVLCYETLEKGKRHDHYRNVHGDGEGFICSCCDKKIVGWKKIEKHIEENGLYDSHRCSFCGKGYHKLFDCKRHIATIHTSECLGASLDVTGDLPPDMEPFGM